MSFISPISKIINNLEEVSSSPTKFLNNRFIIVENPTLKASSDKLYAYVAQILSSTTLSNKEMGKLPRIYTLISTLYPEETSHPVSKAFFEILSLNDLNVGSKIRKLRKSLSLLSLMKEEMKLHYHYYQLLNQSVLNENERMKYTIKYIDKVNYGCFYFDIPGIVTIGFLFKFHSYFDKKTLSLRNDLTEQQHQQLVKLLDHEDPQLANFIKTNLIHWRASTAARTGNILDSTIFELGKLDHDCEQGKRKDFYEAVLPSFCDLKSCQVTLAMRALQQKSQGLSDKWTLDDLALYRYAFDKIRPEIHELGALYEYQYHELQFILNRYFQELPELREVLSKRTYRSIFDPKKQSFSELTESIKDKDNRAKDGQFEPSSFPTPAKFAEDFFAYKMYANVSDARLTDYREYSLPLSTQIIETFSEKIERKENEDEKGTKPVKPLFKRRASYADREWLMLFETHAAKFPAGIKYDKRVEDWFSNLGQKPLSTLQEKGDALKHRLPKLLDVLIGTSYSRSGVFRNQESWYLAMRITALGREFDGVLALTFDAHGIVYHRCFEREAQGNALVNEILPWLIESTQSPTPQDVAKMDQKKKDTNGTKPAEIASIPKGITIEPYFGTLTFEYEDHEIFYNGTPAQMKIEIFKPTA